MSYHGSCVMIKGTLYLIPSILAEGVIENVIPAGTLEIIRGLQYFIVEEIRTARRFLIKAGISSPINDLTFFIFNEHSVETGLEHFFSPAFEGHSIGVLSEAGVPCVADPGALIVRKAHDLEIRVVPLTGPSSILLSLMASGFNGQNFAFIGYLPSEKNDRNKRIREVEQKMIIQDQTQIFIETPYRNLQLFDAIVSVCNPETMLCLATNITGDEENIVSKPIRVWKTRKPDIHKKNTIFLLYHG
ncbi:MAG: SAM-dependent methyltransferase [Bacteroidetes bacterium]|nr:SAM-dependent methyltransferase [Bacteroidota bacterium]